MAKRKKKKRVVAKKLSMLSMLWATRVPGRASKKVTPLSATDPVKQTGPTVRLRQDQAVTHRLLSVWLAREWLWGLILILAVILAYSPVWYAGFIWDDDNHITANPCIVGPLGLREIWTTSAAWYYPLSLTTFWVEHALWGLAPLPYHLVNVFMHAACAVVLWRILQSLLVPGAWLGAALWALHPVQVESVAWITELKNTQSGLFYLLAILFFIRWLRARRIDDGSGGGWPYAWTLLCAAMAMASKSSTVILPLALCLCAWWVEGRWNWRSVARVGPVFLMSVVAAATTLWTVRLNAINDTSPVARSLMERLATAGDVIWFYLGKLLWPHPLIFIYPRWQINAGQWLSYLPLLAAIFVLFFLGSKRKSWSRPYFFAFAYFLACLLPVLGFFDQYFWRYSFVGDHFQYLASMGPLALLSAGLVWMADFVIPKKLWLQSSLCAAILLLLGVLGWQQAWIFQNQETLWNDTLAKNPACWLADNNLGKIFSQRGQMDEAMDNFQKALAINPNSPEAYYNIGNVLLQKRQVGEAIAQYQKALDINPNYTNAESNMGNALLYEGRVDEAITKYQKALEIDPSFAEVRYDLGLAFVQKGQRDEAIDQFQKAIEINPNYTDAYNNLGVTFLQGAQLEKAITEFQMALEIDPSVDDIHYNLGLAFFQAGRVDESIAQLEKTLQINPSNYHAHNDLGNVLLQSGRVDEAMNEFQEALRLKSDYSAARNNLAKAQAMARQNATKK